MRRNLAPLLLHGILVLSYLLGAAGAGAGEPTTRLYLVGVGPGDPDLLTFRAARIIQKADLICCPEEFPKRYAEQLSGKETFPVPWWLSRYYGKKCSEFQGDRRRECEEAARIRQQFVVRVRSAIERGKTVAILDSGDPLVYGPYAWCLEEFEDLNPVVVPGVSCFNAANAALRKGVTTSAHTRSVILTADYVSDHSDTIDKLAAHRCTMVIFTMGADLPGCIGKLSARYGPDTPAAIVKYAGHAEKQQVIRATLGTLLKRIGDEPLPFEYLLYVGDFLTYRYQRP